ncbi:hypothetical protein AHIS1_p038 [Acaryochloris phage A-HIS1]|nr:hypothetical protein AHIS1_p038 [Acaryochloris phage A-HIS1]
MKILVACEESQRVTTELRRRGHEAFSCDILETSGDHPDWHIKEDVTKILSKKWDIVIAFPPCTYLTVSGNRWFNEEKYGDKARKRKEKREKAVEFVKLIYNSCEKVAIENPVGYLSTAFRKPDQIINPYEFGDRYRKRTCLWLKGLPLLTPTDIVTPYDKIDRENGKKYSVWEVETSRVNPKERSKVRSKTFPGIAKAMAEQWT